jgi:hypothetical protein
MCAALGRFKSAGYSPLIARSLTIDYCLLVWSLDRSPVSRLPLLQAWYVAAPIFIMR